MDGSDTLANAEVAGDAAEEPVKKPSKKPLLIGLVLALLLGGGGFYAVFSGVLFGAHAPDEAGEEHAEDTPQVAFVVVESIIINLGDGASKEVLKFSCQLEVVALHQEAVQHLLPRISDVINSYLRAVEPQVLEDPTALVRIRAHLLRRIQMVTGEGQVHDVLITEFILN